MYQIGGFGPDSYTYEKEFELEQLMRKVAVDIAYTIRQIGPNRVIFALDSGSWRKGIEIEENEGYKGHREKSERIVWDNVYRTMDDFCSIMGKQGFIVSKVLNAEADDLMALWMDKLLFQKNEHVVFVSGDEDIRQLVGTWPYDAGKTAFATVFNPFTHKRGMNKKLFVPLGFEMWLNEEEGINDIFNTSTDPFKDTYRSILGSGVDLAEIDGEDIALRKVFCGDKGDNVPAIYTWMAKTAKDKPVQRRITKSVYEKIKKKLGIRDYADLNDHTDAIYEEISAKAKHKPAFDMATRLDRQIQLTVLNRNEFPEEITEKFDATWEKGLDEQQKNLRNATMATLLEGTKYVSETNRARNDEADIFKEIDNISQQLF